jgi:hypothetical protein
MVDKIFLRYYNKVMKQIVLIIIVFLVFFASCATSPYSVKQLTRLLEKQYGEKNRFIVINKIEGTTAYLFHDNKLDIDFAVINRIAQTSIIPFPHHSWGSLLNRGIMYSCREKAIVLANNYELKLISVDNLYGGSSSTYDYIYISEYSEIENAVKLYIDLNKLYNFEHKSEYTVGVHFNYCKPELTTSDSVFIYNVIYFEISRLNDMGEDNIFNNVLKKLKEEWFIAEKYGRIPK